MTLVKIRMNTWNRRGNRDTKFKRGLAPREGFIEMSKDTKQVSLKAGSTKWKGWDTSIPRNQDVSYIQDRKKIVFRFMFFKQKRC